MDIDPLVGWLRDNPGSITAAVVAPGTGAVLVERLRAELEVDAFGIGGFQQDPLRLGDEAESLGRQLGLPLFCLLLDQESIFESREILVRFFRNLDFQRERLASGTVRTLLLLTDATEAAFASLAPNLWDWTTFFRFPGAPEMLHTPVEAAHSLFDRLLPEALGEVDDLESRWRRAREIGLPERTLVENHALPLFLASIPRDPARALELWRGIREASLRRSRPDTLLQAARGLVALAAALPSEPRPELLEASLDLASRALEATDDPSQQGMVGEIRIRTLTTSAVLLQRAGQYGKALERVEECIGLVEALDPADRPDDLPETLRRQAAALNLLLRAPEPSESGLPAWARSAPVDKEGADTEERRRHSDDLGRALEILVASIDGPTDAIAPLFTAWLLSDERELNGPELAEVLSRNPAAYCRGFELYWQEARHTTWEKQVVEPLAQAWARDEEGTDEATSAIRQELEGWMGRSVHAEDRRRWQLEDVAVRIFGERFDPTLVPFFCRHLGTLETAIATETDDKERGRRQMKHHVAAERLGLLLRWSYQERTIPALAAVAEDPATSAAEVRAARDLASELRLDDLPESLRPEEDGALEQEEIREPSLAERLRQGEVGILADLDEGGLPREFFSSREISTLAGDPDAPALSDQDQEALVEGLRALLRTDSARDDSGQRTDEGSRFEAWMPWLARCSPEKWWEVLVELLHRQLRMEQPQWALRQNPVPGLLSGEPELADALQCLIARAVDTEGESLRNNLGLYEFLRWAAHLGDEDALVHCLGILARHEEGAKVCGYRPLPTVLRWALGPSAFEKLGERRRAASRDSERSHWFLVEQAVVPRLPAERALAWCREVLPLAARLDDLRPLLLDRLIDIDSDEVLPLLVNEPLLGDPGDPKFQPRILSHVFWREETERLATEYSSFVENLHFFERGRYLFEARQEEAVLTWAEQLFGRFLENPLAPDFLDFDVYVDRAPIHVWARAHPEAFMALAERVLETENRSLSAIGAFREAILLAWQEIAPETAMKARQRTENPSFMRTRFSVGQEVPMNVDDLWNPAYSSRPAHRELRLRQLAACRNDREIALHGLAARRHRNLDEMAEVGRILLDSEYQLDRLLAISLLAWHPEAETLLEPYRESDPSRWVRNHARWAIEVCRRDRLGFENYLGAIQAEDWLHQQAQFEILVPLLLPTFPIWKYQHRAQLDDPIEALPPRRRALLEDFWYRFTRLQQPKEVLGRDLDKICRGENLQSHLSVGHRGLPWQSMRERDWTGAGSGRPESG